tara:strand:- start:1058 stop:2146 length:1089 start_codon:yes stop_codon:yes gene_type:complete
MNPNDKTVDEFRKDGDGNIIGCPKCGARSLRKDGFSYYRDSKKQQWFCQACYRKTLNPAIVEKSPFTVAKRDPELMPVEDIIEFRKKQYTQKKISKETRKLVDIAINIDGPIGIAHFGDPHVDDDGTDLSQIIHYMDVLNITDGMYCGNLGDIQNNWIGRLATLYGQQSTSAVESWKLTEYFVNKVNWLYLVAGNHDVWSGDGDPLEFIMRDHKGLYERWGARMNLVFPNGKEIRINARHTFKGNSIWNTAHGVARAAQTGWSDHVLTCGHTHISGYQVIKNPASGLISHALQVASFKIMDNYADKLGLDDKNIFNCPVTIIDPRYDDDDNRLITTIFNPLVACEYLNYLRTSYKVKKQKKT